MLRAAGADNPLSGFDGYRPLSAEAGAAWEAEAIVMMEHSLAEAGGVDAVLNVPALAVTRAATARSVLAVEGSYVLNFGPRAAHARRHLARLLHTDLVLPPFVSDSVLVLDGGRRVAFGPPAEALCPAALEAVYGLPFRAVPGVGLLPDLAAAAGLAGAAPAPSKDPPPWP